MGVVKDRVVIAALGVLPKRWLSHFAGVLMSTRLPKPLAGAAVRVYGKTFGVDFDEVRDPLDSFTSVQDFFVRALKEGARPVDDATSSLVAPCDGAWGAAGIIEQGQALQVKGRPYSVAALLDDADLAARFDGGPFATLYLSPRDYHRLHAPLAGEVTWARHVPGALWPVNSAGIRFVDGLFARNERIVVTLRPGAATGAPNGALLALVAVGATMVGKVRLAFDDLVTNDGDDAVARRYEPPHAVAKGAEWGRFEFGSTVVLLATPGWLHLEPAEPGTKVRLGARIGAVG
ncbi:MAG: phosphatidylserine decarboxylase [Deltaproteobacteria bacterium]|nr:phosphatidylserine decarboxylase [Deltaproteobacteria bacterium]